MSKTETATFQNEATARAFIQDCRDAGVKVMGQNPTDGDKWKVHYTSHVMAPSLVSYRQSAGVLAPVVGFGSSEHLAAFGLTETPAPVEIVPEDDDGN